MRWDRFFDDLEDQVASEWEAERQALDTEAERLRLSRVGLRERLSVLAVGDGSPAGSFEFVDGSIERLRVRRVGADWAAFEPDEGRRGALLAPLASVVSIALPPAEVLRSARPSPTPSALSDRITMGFVLRDLVRRRTGVSAGLGNGRVLTGTIDRAGVDHFDLALHDRGAPRRNEAVTGYRLVPFSALAWVRLDGVFRL